MERYIHKVNYYETDKMGITHHSNYIRWMEEARVDYLEQIGFGYKKLEEEGIISPVVGIECEYKESTTFDDEVEVEVLVEEFRGIKLVLKYNMYNSKTNKLVLTGKSKHCFITNGKPVVLKKISSEFAEKLTELVSE